ncbi:DUF1482 family protein [Citrobacter sedlakii]|uniref:DUF1482 family protein n=2 Tax=Enterobacteriaceae TaxID=543 RepID=A0ABS0ZTH3_9ENTR|nr:DUF1482 family protein [Citrobacter sedlakii]MBJ8381674.1 DUF1482 family protein [Citrobacter sedlakii]
MYVLALIFALAGGESKSEVIGAYSTLAQCEAASETKSSPTQCFFLDPEKGLVDVKLNDRSAPQK